MFKRNRRDAANVHFDYDGDECTISFDIPGASRDSVDIKVDEKHITVKATRSEGTGGLAGEYSFELPTPDNVNLTSSRASYQDGVLVLSFMKADKTQRHTIALS